MASPSPPGSRARDRLSDLSDDLLGHVLSFLPNKAAGRAAALSRRWRHIFSSVHTVSFEERAGARAKDWTTFYYDAHEMKSCSWDLLDNVWSALLCRRRCAAAGDPVPPLRRFRFAFDSCHHWNAYHVDQWLAYVLRYNSQAQGLHLDLCFCLGPVCQQVDDEDYGYRKPRAGAWYPLPRGLLSCTAVRSLCLSYCQINLPKAIDLPLLDTMRLTGVSVSSGGSIQRLIASCPRLVDLTLEANNGLNKVSLLDRRLRRFALRCCHNVKTVDIDASELRSLAYSGRVPPESLLSLQGSPQIIPSCTVDFCKVLSAEAEAEEHDRLKRFFAKISNAKRLHLHHRCIPYSYFQGFPLFPNLTRLALQGAIQSPDVLRGILEQTPNLEILSLLMESSVALDGELMAPDEASFSVPCLRRRLREINMVHYQGDDLQRMMARLLLSNALVLERLCVVLVKGPFQLQAWLKEEIQTWLVADHVDKIFL